MTTEVWHPESVIVVAMEEEAVPFLERADGVSGELHTAANAVRRHLTVGGRRHELIRAGIGFVNAAAAAAYALHAFGPETPLISAGTAGGLAAGVRVGEVIVGSRYVNLNADATAFGYALGQVPGMPADYAPDAELAAHALAAGERAEGVTVRSAAIGSSETFVTAGRAPQLRTDFPHVVAVDMETAAFAQFAHTHHQRFLSVRAISDLCAPDGTEFLTHVDDAADRSAEVVLALLAA